MDSLEDWWTPIRSVPHELPTTDLRNPLVPLVTNASVTSQTGEEGLAIRNCRRRLSIFGHVRRLPEATPAHFALRLAVDARTGGKPDIRPEWKCQRGRPCRTRGCSRSRTTLGSTPTTPGGSHMTASLGGRYDPWPVKRSTDWLTDCISTPKKVTRSEFRKDVWYS